MSEILRLENASNLSSFFYDNFNEKREKKLCVNFDAFSRRNESLFSSKRKR